MKISIDFPQQVHKRMLAAVLHDRTRETAAFLKCGIARREGYLRFLVREVVEVPESAYESRSLTHVRLQPRFLARVLDEVESEGCSFIDLHTHPFSQGPVFFSQTDRRSQIAGFPYVARELPNAYHASMVVGPGALGACAWDKSTGSIVPVDSIRVIGDRLTFPYLHDGPGRASDLTRFARQIAAFGVDCQHLLARLSGAIVGAGGIGTQVAMQLAYSGIGKLILVDHDMIDPTNLNRTVGATPHDVGRPKVDVLARRLQEVNPALEVIPFRARIEDSLGHLGVVDVVFGCVDNLGARYLLNLTTAQYLIPYVDIGVEIAAKDGRVDRIFGQVVRVTPGRPCLECLGLLNKERVTLDLLSPEERDEMKKKGYVTGAEIEAPSVIFLNSILSGLGVQEFFNLLFAFKPADPFIAWDGVANKVRLFSPRWREDCMICGTDGRLAMGDLAELPRAQSPVRKRPSQVADLVSAPAKNAPGS